MSDDHYDIFNNDIGMPIVDGEFFGSTGHQAKGAPITVSRLKLETTIVNFSRQTIYVCLRNGIVVALPKAITNYNLEKVVIGYSVNALGLEITTIPGVECNRINAIKSQIASGTQYIYMEEHIDVNALLDKRTGVYVRGADLVLTLNNNVAEINHPFCAQILKNKYLSINPNFSSSHDINVNVRIIDNVKAGKYYAVVNGKVIMLNSKQCVSEQDGIYVTGLTEASSSNTNSARSEEYFDLAQIGKPTLPIPIFGTMADATEYINKLKAYDAADRIRIREHESTIEEMRLERTIMEEKIKQYEHTRKMEIGELEKVNAALKNDIEKEQMKIKHESDKVTYSSKKWIEYTKLAAGLITLGVVAVKVLG